MLTPEQIQQLVQLPLQALLVIAVVALWKAYIGAHNAHISDLRQSYEKNLADLRIRVHLLEDNAGIKPPLMDSKPIPGSKLN